MPSRRPLVLDSCAVLDKTFMKWLEGYHERIVLPPVAYAELAYGYLRKYGTTERLDKALYWADVLVERMQYREALHSAEIAAEITNPDLKENFRDYMIASFAFFPPHLLITNDKGNFAFLGSRVLGMYELMSMYGSD
jgi:predicted nucleic acid-binding protein